MRKEELHKILKKIFAEEGRCFCLGTEYWHFFHESGESKPEMEYKLYIEAKGSESSLRLTSRTGWKNLLEQYNAHKKGE